MHEASPLSSKGRVKFRERVTEESIVFRQAEPQEYIYSKLRETKKPILSEGSL